MALRLHSSKRCVSLLIVSIGVLTKSLLQVASVQSGIEQLNGNITIIATLHSRLGNALDDPTNPDAQQLNLMREETRTLIDNLRNRVKKLETLPAGLDANIRRNQVSKPLM